MKMKDFFKKYWLYIAIVILFILKLSIVHVQPILVKGQLHDDRMVVNAVLSLINDNWLGEYDDITLCKGVTSILFIFFSYKLGISFLMSQQILYFLACISVINVLKHVINKKWILLFCYIILLFNPISYSDAFSFVYRDGIYVSLVMLFFSTSMNIFFNYKSKIVKLMMSSMIFGVVFSAIYLCREETIWMLPYLIIAIGIVLCFIIFDKECNNKIKRIFTVLGLPTLILVLSIVSICTYNYRYYGRFITNDFTSKEFKDMYGALTRIKQENYIKRIPLNEETRKILYDLSPKFNELKKYLDTSDYAIDSKKSIVSQNGEEYRDYQEGYLYWAIRESVNEIGYYKDAQTAKQYYIELAKEVNDLCDSKVLECYPKRSSLIAPFQPELIEELVYYVPETFRFQVAYEKVLVNIPLRKNIWPDDHEFVTNNKAYYENDGNLFELSIMESILKIYQMFNPIITVISIICYIIIMIKFFIKKERFKNYKEVIILNGLLYLFFVRNLTVAFVASTEYKSAVDKCQYLASSYPLQTLFSLLSIIFVIQFIRNKRLFNTSHK